ncbi:uncharacterized protein B0I36DRAFT_357955 [Microdochium trichocladiopsis]|uniref:FAD-binding domain-containing protein n=1 Tax=Microdochium trichocladiopsis TaxID=1682393 RepID=A0A9P8YIM3_9PEZI|nr:uncharacterized protein B0I36DRAFT_357955 [Microdochium trichocladiopsis]KAH7040687.1 hypothetical protein B0I36DRAFT_357955 [Microdochium trichocladiopsis]
MHDAGLVAQFKSAARLDADYYRMIDKQQRTYFAFGSSTAKERPEIDRNDLRRILLDSLPVGSVRWGQRPQRIDPGGTLVFREHTEKGYDLVVGCEGTWSKTRDYVTDVKPHFAGVEYTKLTIRDAGNTASDLVKLVNNGNLFAHSEGQFLSAQQLGDDSLYIGRSTTTSQDRSQRKEDEIRDPVARKRAILDEMQGWSAQLQRSIEKAEVEGEPKDLYVLPPDHRWTHVRGVTLIGDAAHVMTPFAGEGVNTALDDARRLAAVIIGAVGSGGVPGLSGYDDSPGWVRSRTRGLSAECPDTPIHRPLPRATS